MRKLLFSFFLLSAAVTANASTHTYTKADTLWTGKPYVTDVRALLTGQIPGVVVTSSLGAPGMTPSVFIQGYRPGMEEPLYIVDGMRVLHLDTLAPDSIDGIEILTGAKAMSLYGPAAANGALVIRTKSAKRKGFHASYSFTGAVHQLAWEPQQISKQEWARYFPKYGENRYLQSENNVGQIGASFAQTHHLDAQYRNKKFNAAATFDYLDNDGPFKDRVDAQQRFSGSARIEYQPLHWLRAELSATMGKSDISKSNAMHRILLNYPVDTNIDFDPYVGSGSRLFKDFTGNALVEFLPCEGLSLRAHAGYTAQRSEDSFVQISEFTKLDGEQTIIDWKYFQYDLETTYQHYFGAHELRANLLLRGQSVDPAETKLVINAPLTLSQNAGNTWTYVDYFAPEFPKNYSLRYFVPEKPLQWGDGRIGIEYGYSNLLKLALDYYLLHADNEGHSYTFHVPSVQAGWDAGHTPFMRSILPDWWKEWRWNAAWSFTNYYPDHKLPIHTMLGTMIQSSRLEAGTNLRIWDLYLGASWFSGRDRYDYSTPFDLDNRGWTFSADWAGSAGEVHYLLGINATLYKNQCSTSKAFLLDPGLIVSDKNPIGVMWLHDFAGLDSEGNAVYKTYSNDSNRNFFGNGPFPTTTIGFHFDLQWHRWTLNVSGHGNFGQSVMRSADPLYGTVDNGHDLLARHYMIESWSGYNAKGKYPNVGTLEPGDNFFMSTAMLHDASFFRIDQISLQYRLPVRRLHANVQLFASLENFFLFTSYPGSDPEYNLSWDNPGYERGSYPSTRRIVFGARFDL